jgi:predicted permease
VEETIQDTRYAWRGLRRNPVFALTAVVSLGLAIGANTAIYSIVDAVLLRPLPLPQPEMLFTLSTPEMGVMGVPASGDGDTFSYPLYEQLNAAAAGSARIALFDAPNRVDVQDPDPEAAPGTGLQQFVSVDAFDVLGVAPVLGRFFSAADDRLPSPHAVVVLSHDYWRRQFHADPSILGKSLVAGGRSYTIVGVAREGFTGVEPGRFVDFWLPITLTDPSIFSQSEYRPFRLLGRLGAGATREQVEARLQPVFHRHQLERIGTGSTMPPAMARQLAAMTLQVRPGASGQSTFRRSFTRPLWILMGVAVGVLLIACSSVASLLLARSAARSSELALRVCLGAGRTRLVRQLLTESLLISILASVGGWVLARALAPALVAMTSSPSDPVRVDLALDGRVLLFCAGTCALSALFFGTLPAWHAAVKRPRSALLRVAGDARHLRMGRLFVAVQVAFAFCLVAGGAGFVLGLRNLAAVERGFDASDVAVLTLSNSLGPQQWAVQLSLMRQLEARTAELPRVQGAAAAWMAVFSGDRRGERVVMPGKHPSVREETFYRVSPNYFVTLRTPLLEGRGFTLRDNDDEPVPTVVNRAFTKRYFEGESPLGREFRRTDGVRHQVVGIAADSHYGDLRNGPEPIAYMPMKPPRTFTLYVRSTLDAVTVAKLVQREAADLGAEMRVTEVTTLRVLVGSTIQREKLLAAIGGAFAFLGIVLAAGGLFGLLNYSVTRRTKEFGIRAALGAQRRTLLGLVTKDELTAVAGGLVVGVAGSLVLLRICGSLLFGVEPADPAVMGTAIAVFVVAALIAAAVPAVRAAAIDPIIALRHE